MKKSQSEEDYLERILLLHETIPNLRAIEIVEDMNFSKPSVSIAMKKLKNKELISIDKSGYITLTPEGEKIARNTYEKHRIISKLLMLIGVNEDIALEDACQIEHCLSEESFKKIKEYCKIKGLI